MPLRAALTVLLISSILHQATPAKKAESSSSVVSRAIEQTKRRQAATPPKRGVVPMSRQQQRSFGTSRLESINVDLLNQLIKSFDKTWVSPKLGSKEPAGSNFQYKKTCASIYKARHGACSQLGFGSMCFNYCFEKGEKLQYACVDASDAAYCKSSSNFNAFLSKYKRDAYKAKAYIHQMLSRCFATSICNAGTGILNSSHIDATTPLTTRKPEHIRLTKPPGATRRTKTLPLTTTTTTELPTTTARKAIPIWQKLLKGTTRAPRTTTRTRRITTEAPKPEEESEESEEEELQVSTKKSIKEIIDEISEEEETKSKSKEKSGEDKESEEEEERVSTKSAARLTIFPFTSTARSMTTHAPITTTAPTTALITSSHKEWPHYSSTTVPPVAIHTTKSHDRFTIFTTSTTPATRMTWKHLSLTTIPSVGPEYRKNERDLEAGFWTRFQPNRWYPSVHYITNTGRR